MKSESFIVYRGLIRRNLRVLGLFEYRLARYCIPADIMTAEDSADYLILNVKMVYQLANARRIHIAGIGDNRVFPKY